MTRITAADALRNIVHDIRVLSENSEGVAGLHINGDIAPWSELTECGILDSWLGKSLEEADAALLEEGIVVHRHQAESTPLTQDQIDHGRRGIEWGPSPTLTSVFAEGVRWAEAQHRIGALAEPGADATRVVESGTSVQAPQAEPVAWMLRAPHRVLLDGTVSKRPPEKLLNGVQIIPLYEAPPVSALSAEVTKAMLDDTLEFHPQREKDEKDAARYRFLRSRDLECINDGGVFAGMTPENLLLNGSDLDESIDAAIAAAKCRQA